MTYAPATIKALAAYLVAHRFGNSGIVGDAAHQARASYHNGQDAITAHGRTAANDYSIRTARDREPHLTDAAAGLDIGKGNSSLADLQNLSRYIVAECRRNAPGTSDIREVIYSPDGATVLRWDRERGYASAPQPGEADASHLWHTHVSFYRDSEARDKVGPWRGYFEEALVQTIKGEDFRAKSHPAFPAGNGALRAAPQLISPILTRLATGTVVRSIGELVNTDGSWRVTEHGGKVAWLLYRKADGAMPDWEPVTPGGDPAVDAELTAYIARNPDPTPYGPADIEAAKLDGRRAEWERQSKFAIVTLAAKP